MSKGTAGIPLEEILPIIRQIAAALDHAHENKVVHRDVKPSNVMVDEAGRVKVLDFGLAAQIHTSFSRVSQVRYGTSGTGPYMAPEQWRGQYQDGATDQYALAVLAYELLAGHCPFESHETSVLRETVLKEEPGRIKGIPDAAWQALKRGLAKGREERFGSCGDFAAALGGDKDKLRNARNARKGTANGRKWTQMAAGVVVLAGLAWGGYRGYLTWQDREKAKAEQAQRAAAVAQMDAERRAQADGLRGEVEAALARGDLKTAGEKLAGLQGIAGAQDMAEGLRKQYEAAAGAQDVRKRYAAAKRGYDDAMRIPDGPGFEARKRNLNEKWIAAERADKDQAWGEALSAYDAVVADCQDMAAADAQRREAEAQKQKTDDVRQAAAKARAAEDAPKLWEQAAATEQQAGESFSKGDFAGAMAQWRQAEAQYASAKQRADAVRAYLQAKKDYEQTLGGSTSASSDLLDRYGGPDWKTAREKATEGFASSDQPEAGRQAYAEALAALTAALAEVEKKATPSLVIEAMAAGKKVSATVTDGKGGSWTTPTPLGLKKGSNYAFTVSYPSDPSGKRWKPAALKVTADWAGPQAQKVSLVEVHGPVAGQDWKSEATGMKFVWIQQLGIWVGQYEVTNDEFKQYRPGHDSGSFEGHSLSGPRQPVVNVNFPDDALPFVKWLNDQDDAVLAGAKYRLPSEAEWLAFAQCGDGRTYPWGDEMPPTYGNYHGQEGAGSWPKISGHRDEFPVTCPVEKSGKNDWGLYGVGGNVWEMAASDKTGASFGAWRGTSWFLNNLDYLRCDYRLGLGGSARYRSLGFRLVLSR